MLHLLLLLACGSDDLKDDDTGDTAGSTTVASSPTVTSARTSCPDALTWSFVLTTDASISNATINVWEVVPDAGGWDEEHPLVAPPVGSESGDTVEWTLEADRVYDAGYATVFQCGVHDTSDAMAYVARIYDDTSVYVDCVAWGGDRVAEVLAAPLGGGDVTSYADVDRPDEISPELCRVL